ncbi:cation diffusion facilitator family transporter [Allonocardiopsis opalescens]|uniref:Cation diffusion facilitator family transporter n=1 Tax=Allonocardiopsis opalescens TaxID=1144618 RepID=A0A2T0PWC6_9ACTN|nr:cation diffusion facilitator family transporter [Allonocardiopsis opalescens]PRX95730.1 cation diffusion facilitator family transporter [Allonocardiopsis opalescens]
MDTRSEGGTAPVPPRGEEASGGDGESRLTVIVALLANLGIAVAKAVAAVITGSAAMAAEAAHSVADSCNEVLLLQGLRLSARPADRRHPFGYGKERYFWSLLVAVTIFGMGALFAFLQGFEALTGGRGEQEDPLVAYVVLLVAMALETVSWVRALRDAGRAAREHRQRLLDYVRHTDDPPSVVVLLEDSAALVGLLLALGGIGLHQLTGSAVWDGIASLLIGVVLTLVALALGRINRNLLIGSQADPRLVRAIGGRLRDAPEVEALVDLVTMTTGHDKVLVCARLDFRDTLSSAELERACVRIAEELGREHPEVDEVFLEPVPRDDPAIRAHVLARYGWNLDDRPADRDGGGRGAAG